MTNIRRLDWEITFVDRGDGHQDPTGFEADSGFGPWYEVTQYLGSDSYGWEVTYDSIPLSPVSDFDDPDKAKESAQDDFEKRAWSALTSV